MNLGIYKQGQGHWTRLMSFLGWGTMFAWGASWLWGQLAKIDFARNEQGEFIVEPQYIRGGAALLVVIIGAILCYWFSYNNQRSGEFLISTESEMKKVNWSSKKEITGSTWVVVSIALLLGVVLFLIDLGFSTFFKGIGLLQSG